MSALWLGADIWHWSIDVSYVPEGDLSRCNKNSLSKGRLFDHLVGAGKYGSGP
jgi:hypothetical protein